MHKFILLALSSVFFLTSCYKMPGDCDFSTIPTTNNPSVTKDSGSASPIPGIGY